MKIEGLPRRAAVEAGIAVGGMCLFGIFAHERMPLALLAVAGLLATAYAIYRSLGDDPSLSSLLGFSFGTNWGSWWLLLGWLLGLGLAILYRWKLGLPPLPEKFGLFAPVAACVGAAEEALYRGYVQGRLSRLGRIVGIAGASVGHTMYKCSLFILPVAAQTDFVFLIFWTFAGGLAFGAMRAASKSVLPPLAAHAVFDILVYGELVNAPWWVWK